MVISERYGMMNTTMDTYTVPQHFAAVLLSSIGPVSLIDFGLFANEVQGVAH